jgi:hypothetical protein
MKATQHIIALLAMLTASGCVGQGTQKLPEASVVWQLKRPAGYRNPTDAKRPDDLKWHPTENGLELAAWTVDGFHYVFCAVRNPTQKPIKYPAGCGLGWWEFTGVDTKTERSPDWTEVEIRPESDAFPRAVTGIGPIEMDLGPGKEARPQALLETSYSFCVDLWEYQFPPNLPKTVSVRIESLQYVFPVVKVQREMIRRGEQDASHGRGTAGAAPRQ